MHTTSRRILPLELPLARPFKTARGTFSTRRSILLEVERDGHRGWGEATTLPEWGTEEHHQSLEALRQGNPDGSTPAALFAWECAIADAAARRAGIPLYRYLARAFGTQPVDHLDLNATVGSTDRDRTIAQFQEIDRQGFKTVKLKVGVEPIPDDLSKIRTLRDAFPQLRLRLDANQAFALDEAHLFLAAVAPLGIEYLEEPTADPRQFTELAEHGVRLAADESCTDSAQLHDLIEARRVEVLVIKPMTLGRLTTTADLVARARAHGMQVVLTSAIESAVGRAATAHLACALGIEAACGLAIGSFFARDTGPWNDGPRWQSTDDPGLGFTPTIPNGAAIHP